MEEPQDSGVASPAESRPSVEPEGAQPHRDVPGLAPAERKTPLRPPGVRLGDSKALSVPRFLVELLTITAGVLIALSLEGVREWVQERRLVREAQESLAREIRDNLAEVQSVLDAEGERRQKLEQALQLANELLETDATGISQVDLGLTIAELSSASWETAERTGAIAHMDYETARTYAGVYEKQTLLTTHQDRMLERIAAAAAGLAQDPLGALPSDLEQFRQHVLYLLGDLAVEQQLARMLSESYREVMAAPAGAGS